MHFAHILRHRCSRLSFLTKCLALFAAQAALSNTANADHPPAANRPRVEASDNGNRVLIIGKYLQPGDYQVYIENKNSGIKLPTGIFLNHPANIVLEITGPTATMRLSGLSLKPGTLIWLRHVEDGPTDDSDVGNGVAPSDGKPDPHHSRSAEAAEVIDAVDDWMSSLLPAEELHPGSNQADAPRVLASVTPHANSTTVTRRGFGVNTTMMFTLNSTGASWPVNSATIEGDGLVASTINSQVMQFQFTEHWDVFEERSVSIHDLGLDVQEGTAWVGLTVTTIGQVDEIVTDSEFGNLSMTFGEPGDESTWSKTFRVAGVPNLGETNGDQRVDIEDLLVVLGHYGQNPEGTEADTNLDGVIEIADLLNVIGNWGAV